MKKMMVISNKEDETCNLRADGIQLEQLQRIQVSDGRCDREVNTRTRITMAKDCKEAFWQHKELFRGNLKLAAMKRLLDRCVLNYGRDSWTLNKTLIRRIDAFQPVFLPGMFPGGLPPEIANSSEIFKISRC